MDKAPDAFKTISEVAEELDVPQHVLRFWETRFSQIKPMKRGGGRRYYRPNDVDLLKGIRFLLYGQGYTIRGVQRILKENGISDVAAIGRGELGVDHISPVEQPNTEPRAAKVVRTPEPEAKPQQQQPENAVSAQARSVLEAAYRELEEAHAMLTRNGASGD